MFSVVTCWFSGCSFCFIQGEPSVSEFSKFRRCSLILIMHEWGHLLCQRLCSPLGWLWSRTMSLQPPGVAQLTASSRKSRVRWEMGRETLFGRSVELVEGMEGIPWHWDWRWDVFGDKSSRVVEEEGGFSPICALKTLTNDQMCSIRKR